MELMETLEELKDLNQRHAKVDLNLMLQQKQQQLIDEIKQQEDEDEAMIKLVYKTFLLIKRILFSWNLGHFVINKILLKIIYYFFFIYF